MSNFQTVQGLVTLIRARTDQINSPTFSDTNELIPWTRSSLAQLHEILTSRWIDWYVVKRPLSLQANNQFYTLPPDFRALQSIWLIYSGGLYREKINLIEPNNIGNYNNQQNAYGRWCIQYQIQRNQLYLTPIGQTQTPNMLNAMEIWYTPQYKPPLLNFTPLDDVLPNGWEEWVVLDVMEKMKIKMQLDVTATVSMKNEQANRLLAAAAVRDGDAPQMQDYLSNYRNLWVNAVPGGPGYWTGTY